MCSVRIWAVRERIPCGLHFTFPHILWPVFCCTGCTCFNTNEFASLNALTKKEDALFANALRHGDISVLCWRIELIITLTEKPFLSVGALSTTVSMMIGIPKSLSGIFRPGDKCAGEYAFLRTAVTQTFNSREAEEELYVVCPITLSCR